MQHTLDSTRTEEQVRNAKERLDRALDAARVMAWDYDVRSGRSVRTENAWQVMNLPTEGTPEEFLRRVHEDDRPRVRDAWERAARRGGPYEIEFRVVMDSGALRWISERVEVQLDPEGKPLRISGVSLDVTDRKRADEDRDRFALLVQNSPNFVGIADINGIPVFANRTAMQLVGAQDLEEVRSTFVPDFFVPEERAFIREVMLPTVLQDGRWTGELRLQNLRTGTEIPVICDTFRIDDPVTGKPTHFATVTHDISKLKRVEAERERLLNALASQEAQLSEVFERSPAFKSLFSGPGHVFERVNESFRNFINGRAVLGKPVRDAFPELMGQGLFEVMDHVYQTGQSWVGKDVRVSFEREPGGALVEGRIDLVFQALRDANGRVAGVFCHGTDLTRQRRAEEALRDSEQRFRMLVEASAQAVWETDSDGMVVNDSPSWRAYTGQTVEEWMGHGWMNAVHPEDREYMEAQWRRSIAERRPLNAEYRLRHVSGGWRWTNERSAPILGPDGTLRKWVGMNFDITDRKAAEDALKDSDRRKDEFLAMLAHELRNPLAPIRNAAHYLGMKSGGDPGLERARAMVDRQVNHMARLLDDLLDVSRVSQGKVRLEKQPLDLASVLDQALETNRSLIDSRRHELTVAKPMQPAHVAGDRIRLVQVLSNLLENAAKYTDPGGRIWVSLESNERDAVIRVRDNGRGIDPGELDRLFDLFHQAGRTLDRSEGGLGIGLSLVRSLVTLHGGRVSAFSAGHGQGSEFVVRLPLVAEYTVGAEQTGSAAPGAGDRKKLHILVVDDNDDAATSTAMLLNAIGHETKVAHDGREALHTAGTEHPEVVLLDIGLPRMNGYEVCRLMRQLGLQGTLIVAVSGYGQEEDRRKSRESGFNAHLTKPLDLAELQLLLDGVQTEKH
jgi:PAS domain S-box-containing protein